MAKFNKYEILKKLLYITTNIQGSGGVSRVLSVRLNYLIKTYGYEVHVIATNNKSNTFFFKFNDRIIFHNISIRCFKLWHLPMYKRTLQHVLDQVAPDIIVNCDNGLKGALLPYLINTKASLVYEMHASKDLLYNEGLTNLKFKLANYFVQKTMGHYERFVVLTESHTKEWKGRYIEVIHNPISINLSKALVPKKKVVLAVGRFSFEKGYGRLLQVWSKVFSKFPEWTLAIYGDGSKTACHHLLKQLELSDTVKLYDATKKIEQAYIGASVFVNTSLSEAFPLTMIEALHFGLPVVAFETIGAKQLISDNENGYLIPQNDEEYFIRKLQHIMSNDEIRNVMSYNATKSVEKYHLETIMNQWHQLFQSIV
jgi:glycosyltransferase involved in cell wall biosynthesis